jgi:hypothetical protein
MWAWLTTSLCTNIVQQRLNNMLQESGARKCRARTDYWVIGARNHEQVNQAEQGFFAKIMFRGAKDCS